KLHQLKGEVGAALRDSVPALKVANETAQAWRRSIALRIYAEALLGVEPPRVEEAEDEVRAAIDVQARRECVFDLAWSRIALASVLMGRAGREEAVATLPLAARMFVEVGVDPGIRRAVTMLATLAPDGPCAPARVGAGRAPGD